ncbi:hypothetical protein RhiirA4_394388 [Rhizophagus irregularis]|uniref:Uncharacterized protein n=1 Tax=Rhizophagus irregularis TaxID=588596 RepID=A0A2I1G0U6_9GLOM|nr:hypothetical protein RhiirA4_394388 [Rhizophagus irregularis]
MATNREREAERDLDAREKQIRDREIMARKLAEWGDDIEADSGQEEYYKDRSRWWFHQQQFRAHTREAMEAELNNEKEILTLSTIGASQNNSVKPELTLNLASKCIKSKRKRRILVPLKYSDNEDDENKTEERKKKINENILSKKLQPFVSKRIVEYLGVQEDELVSEDLTKEMMMVC